MTLPASWTVELEPAGPADARHYKAPAIRAADITDTDPPEEFAGTLGTDEELWLFAGDGGSFKTSAMLALFGAKTVGANAFDCPDFPTTPGNVLLVTEEDGEGIIRNHLDALIAGHGWDAGAVLDRFHVMALAGVDLADRGWQEHIKAEALRVEAKAAGFDPLYYMTPGESNDDLKRPIRFARELVTVTGGIVILAHHNSKPTEGRAKKHAIRGGIALYNAARVVWHFEETAEGVALECSKMSRAKRPEPIVLRHAIETAPGSRAVWRSARFTAVERWKVERDRAEDYIRAALAGGAELNTTELKAGATKVEGVSAVDVSEAKRRMEDRGELTYQPGPNKSKLWRLGRSK